MPSYNIGYERNEALGPKSFGVSNLSLKNFQATVFYGEQCCWLYRTNGGCTVGPGEDTSAAELMSIHCRRLPSALFLRCVSLPVADERRC